MFSQTVEYALRAVVYLAQHRAEGAVGNRTIAQATQVPTSYLSKVLHDLAAAEILVSRRGVGGGFQLRQSPDELSVLDVVNAVDPLQANHGLSAVAGVSLRTIVPDAREAGRSPRDDGKDARRVNDPRSHVLTRQTATVDR